MTIDLSEFKATTKKLCVVTKFVLTLSAEEQEQFKAAVAEPVDEIKTASIVRWLYRRGATFRENVVYNHRNGACACP